jgi:glutamyl-tRNA synthetase
MSATDHPRRVRFAPSPTGSLHLGNARTALFNWIVARQSSGRLVLRIEDTDLEREKAGSEEGILTDLRWLGLEWDEGPDVGGASGPYRQSERTEIYREAAERLLSNGHAYRCFCDEQRLAAEREQRIAAGRAPHYAGTCRRLDPAEAGRRAAAGEPHVLRFATRADVDPHPSVGFVDRLRGPLEFPLKELGDTVIVRRDGRPTYNFAVVVDDAAMEIDLVVRGEDHISNTPRQVLIYRALGRPVPEFVHLPMVRAGDGSRLSKRHGAVSVADYREQGYPVEGLINALALLGWSPGEDRTLLDTEELLRIFDLDAVSRSPAAFDQAKLDWICSQHLLQTPGDRLAPAFRLRLTQAGLLPSEPSPDESSWMSELADLLKKYVSHDAEVPEHAAPVFYDGSGPRDAQAREVLDAVGARRVVAALAEETSRLPVIEDEAWREIKNRVRDRAGVKGKGLFQPLRVAMTGEASGPELDRLAGLVEQGHRLFPQSILSVAERVRRTLAWLDAS